jgi:5-formyltetrahydrofolate cyclo-ligase
MIEKEELREQALLHLDRLRADNEDVEGTARLFRENVIVKDGQIVAAYWPIGPEFDVRYIVDDLLARGIKVALPVPSKTSREMAFSLWDGQGDLVKGAYGVFVPPTEKLVEPDIVLVPMLAFDRKGNRLGRGAGHYDATLAALRARKDVLVIGVAYAAQAVLFNLPSEDHDQKMDMILTPNGVQNFRN